MTQMMQSRRVRNGQAGFSLLEMLVALAILSAAAYVALDTVESDTGQTRYQITENRLEKIRKAIVGNPDLVLNGSPVVSGYVADVGQLPRCLDALISRDPDCNGNGVNDSDASETPPVPAPPAFAQIGTTGVGAGWRGPYLTAGRNGIRDGWGTPVEANGNWGWVVATSPSFVVSSLGRNRINGGAAGSYDEDQAMVAIDTGDFRVDLSSAQINFQALSVATDTQVCMAILTADPAGANGWSLIYTTTPPPNFIAGVPDNKQFNFTGDVTIGTRRLIAYDANADDAGTPIVNTADCTPAAGYTKDDLLTAPALIGSQGFVFAPKVTPITTLSLALP